MESWIFKVSIYKCAAKFATRKNSKILLKAVGLKNYKWKYGNMVIWKYGNMDRHVIGKPSQRFGADSMGTPKVF